MKKAVLISVLLSALLTGCGFLNIFKNPDTKTEPVGTNNKVIVDEKLLQPCQDLTALPSENATFDDIAEHYINTIGLYGICKNKQQASIKTIKKLANIETDKK